MSCHLHGASECTCPAYLIAMGQNNVVVEADLAREEYNTYMREYMRRKHPGRQPRKEIYEAKRAEFERVVRVGGYGSLASLSRQIGIAANTRAKWLRDMRAKLRAA